MGYIPFDQDAANLFFQLIASRYEPGSVMVTSNLPFGRGGETFSDDIVAAAMIDRLLDRFGAAGLAGRTDMPLVACRWSPLSSPVPGSATVAGPRPG